MNSSAPINPRLLLIVIDGLGSDPLRRAVADGHAPNIQTLLDAGARFDDAISPFPSLTPVCLSTIATGVGPDLHRIPSLGWYSRGRGRFVEYGSSFAAAGIEGRARSIENVVVDLNMMHLAEDPPTIFERVQDAGMRAASINHLIYRGRTRHTMKHDYGPLAAVGKRARVNAVYGPDHLYFGELYGSLKPIIPQVGIKRPLDWGGGHIARYLMRNTGVDFVLLYLGQHDAKSHKFGPAMTQKAIRVADRAIGRTFGSLGGVDACLQKFAVMLCSDHGQTEVDRHVQLEDVFDDVELFRGSRGHDAEHSDLAIIGSNRVAMAYRTRQPHHGQAKSSGPGHVAGPTDRWIAERACESEGTDLAAWINDGTITVCNRGGGELRARRDYERGTPTARGVVTGSPYARWFVEGDLEVLDIAKSDGTLTFGDYPDALHRLAGALECVNSGDVMISAVPGVEFTDIGGSAHSGGSHGSLHKTDSTAPLISVGLQGRVPDGLPTIRLSDIPRFAGSHLGVGGIDDHQYGRNGHSRSGPAQVS